MPYFAVYSAWCMVISSSKIATSVLLIVLIQILQWVCVYICGHGGVLKGAGSFLAVRKSIFF